MANTIIDLTKLNGAVYIYVPNKDIEKNFLLDAETEGFTFGNGKKPTSSLGNDLYRLEDGLKICHVGYVGHLAYKTTGKVTSDERHYINYEKYVLGMDDYDDLRLGKES